MRPPLRREAVALVTGPRDEDLDATLEANDDYQTSCELEACYGDGPMGEGEFLHEVPQLDEGDLYGDDFEDEED